MTYFTLFRIFEGQLGQLVLISQVFGQSGITFLVLEVFKRFLTNLV